uniref:Immunoglobulin C1-set domain-containing protein n=1 Tax=Sinocyclocheilus anshuiensis TaxID=1608454 RepID=A0A671Q0G0_9TELE
VVGVVLKSAFLLLQLEDLERRIIHDSGGFRVSCLATGFYPRHINLTLFRDGQLVSDHEITGGDLLPNADGTYQMRKSLEIRAADKHRYTCSFRCLNLIDFILLFATFGTISFNRQKDLSIKKSSSTSDYSSASSEYFLFVFV